MLFVARFWNFGDRILCKRCNGPVLHTVRARFPVAPASRADYGTTALLVAPAKDEQYAVSGEAIDGGATYTNQIIERLYGMYRHTLATKA